MKISDYLRNIGIKPIFPPPSISSMVNQIKIDPDKLKLSFEGTWAGADADDDMKRSSKTMYKILEQGENLNLVIDENETEFKPLIMKGTWTYDPETWEPNPKVQYRKILDIGFREEATMLFEKARAKWNPNKDASKPTDTLNALIADSVAKIAADDVVEAAKPLLDKFIAETYGMIPKRLEVVTPKCKNIVQGVTHEKFEMVLNLVNADIPVFLTGPAGSGKNVLCKQISEAIGTEFYFSNAVTQEYKLTGFIDANGRYHETQFFKAFTEGGLFMLDEMDASTPEVLVILNAAIANKYFDFPTGRTDAHEDFRLIAAGNTYGTGADIEYTGRYQLDAASLDRFAVINIDYSKAIEEAMSAGNKHLLQFIWRFRDAVKKSKIKFVVSYRAIERLHKLEDIFDTGEAIKICLIRSLDMEDVRMIERNMHHPGEQNPYSVAFRQMVA